ncbi:hypothetical protein [Tsukamurella paurometabola]|uniref:Uncharacterized protein n=1 Tax=Tsukamurella paurometabola TaxID=2061 RepID=A0A3P8MAF4_TSUPA|nr:hypothetical protein [Tsukamurella paurometabola]UEA81166.1 hypothetical protein LK411_12125 [Tsukamurella paurometabola]VDR38140.1 Uncharacterised protein [Tsukamurella paurometabola]
MIDRPDTPHADVLLEGIWEDEVTPDDLASRALSAAQASSYAFRVASEGTTATAQLGEVDVAEFLETETGKWAQSFIGIVRVGESLVHVSHALGELARSLQQVNLEQSEIVYQVEAEIEAAQRQSAQAGVDPAEQIAELIAAARARAAEVAEKMVTPETASSAKKPAAGLVSGFMAFGRVPGASAEAAERNGRVARNGHARNGYAIRTTRTEQNGHGAPNGHGVANGYSRPNGNDVVTGHDAMNGHDPHDAAVAEHADAAQQNAAAAAQDAFANSGDETTMDLGFMGFGRTPSTVVPAAGDATAGAERATENTDDADAEESEAAAPVVSNGFLGLGDAPAVTAADDAGVPVVPQPMVNGFMAFGRTPGTDGAAVQQGPSSGPIPVAAPTQFLPIPVTPAQIVAGETDESAGVELGTPLTLSRPEDGPSRAGDDTAADTMDEGFLSFGRVPTAGAPGGSGVLPTVPVTPGSAPPEDGDDAFEGPDGAADESVARADESNEDESDDEAAEAAEETTGAIGEVQDAAAHEQSRDDAEESVEADDEPVDGADDAADELVLDDVTDEQPVDDEPADAEVDFADELDADEVVALDAEDEFDDDADEPVADESAPANDAEAVEDIQDVQDVADEPADDAGDVEDVADEPADDAGDVEVVADEPAEAAEPAHETEPEAGHEDDDAPAAPAIDETTAEVVAGPAAEEARAEAPVEAPERTDAPAVPAPKARTSFAEQRPVRKSGPVKFSDLLKAANANKVDPAHVAPAALVASGTLPADTEAPDAAAPAATDPAVAGTDPVAGIEAAESADTGTAPAASTPDAGAEAPADEAPVKPAPVLATGPVILGRTEPLVLGRRVSPAVQQVHDTVASILGSLRGGPHGPETGLHWAAGLLVRGSETIMAVTTSDAGWLPPGVLIPAGARVLWNTPTGYRWASIDDPARQLIEYARQDGYTLTAIATTHPSRAYAPVVGESSLVRVTRPGAVLPGGRSRFEVTVSPARLQHIRSLDREQAERQARALIRDLETQPIAPEHAIGIEAARIDARCFLDERDEVPPAVLDQLHTDERALGDALSLDRVPASAADLGSAAPEAARLRDRMLERAILVATLAAAYHDIESAVYAWTYARFLSSQDQDPKQAR